MTLDVEMVLDEIAPAGYLVAWECQVVLVVVEGAGTLAFLRVVDLGLRVGDVGDVGGEGADVGVGVGVAGEVVVGTIVASKAYRHQGWYYTSGFHGTKKGMNM
jgi:hypothetical protein